MRRVIVHGFSPEPIMVETAAATMLEVLESIGRQLPQLRVDPFHGPKQVAVVGYHTLEDLAGPIREDGEDIEIVPAFAGAKSGLGQILLGGLLIALSFVPGMQFAAGFLFKIGALLILGGIMQMLSPAPKVDQGDTRTEAQYLGSPKNTVKIGTRIPIIVGMRLWGGQYLAFDVNAVQVQPYYGTDDDEED